MNGAVLVFVATAYALSIVLGLVVGLTGGYEGRLIGLRYLSMLIPALAVLVCRFTMPQEVPSIPQEAGA